MVIARLLSRGRSNEIQSGTGLFRYARNDGQGGNPHLHWAIVCLVLPLMLSGCAVPLVGGIGAIGFSAVEDRGISGVASDQTLRVKLTYELTDFEGIEMTIYKGRVLFTGVVANAAIKSRVVEIARNVMGVKEILDYMKVDGEDSFAEYTRDAWMTTKLKGILYTDEDIIAPNYLVRTFDKTIYIFGTAQTAEEMQKVMTYAFDITGVRNVVNLMELRKP